MPISQCKFERDQYDLERDWDGEFFDSNYVNETKQGKADYHNWLRANFGIHHPKLVNLYDSQFGYGTKIGSFTEIGGSTIGRNCSIQAHVFIPPGTIIEDGVFIGPRVTILNDKYPEAHNREWKNEPVVIKSGAVIGGGAVLLPGVVIHAYAVVGAGAVVTKSVSAGSTVIGNPAKEL